MFPLLYADGIIIFTKKSSSRTTNEFGYFSRILNRLVVNTCKMKMMGFRRGGILP